MAKKMDNLILLIDALFKFPCKMVYRQVKKVPVLSHKATWDEKPSRIFKWYCSATEKNSNIGQTQPIVG